ncbi:RraA family protein [Clostridium sp. Marseille-P3244]|uniref:RraA family protein n=1 Tax=Clostridium sp. Marseille-P3244 TaxID=1871020 RepID=UPI00093002C7|nr:RraA family protein [Clostridium sp. Marseille-P3244]
MNIPKIDKAVIEEYKKLDSTSISDAMDKIGLPAGLYGIKPIVPGTVMCGQAFTVRYVPCGEVKGTVGDFLDDVEPGQVCVLDNGGRDYCTVWGDIMAMAASLKGIEGTLIYGVCRDIKDIRNIRYPIFSNGYYMVTGKDRVEVAAVNEPVTVAGLKVCPGDLIFGDDTGALVIPFDKVEQVLGIAKEIEKKEEMIRQYVKGGMSLREARAQTGYHHLQTKEAE